MGPFLEHQQHQQQATAGSITPSPSGGDSDSTKNEEIRGWMQNLLHEAGFKDDDGDDEEEAKRKQNEIDSLKGNESTDEESARPFDYKINDGKHESTSPSQAQIRSGVFSAAIAIFVTAPSHNGHNKTDHSVSPKTMTKKKHRVVMLDDTYTSNDDDLSVAAEARQLSRKSITTPLFNRRNSILASVTLSVFLAVLIIGSKITLTNSKGNKSNDESAVGSLDSPPAVFALMPSAEPSILPSAEPSNISSVMHSTGPSSKPSIEPSDEPSIKPSDMPSTKPSMSPSSSTIPTTSLPTVHPSDLPSRSPTSMPTSSPTDVSTLISPTSSAPNVFSFFPGDFTLIPPTSSVPNTFSFVPDDFTLDPPTSPAPTVSSFLPGDLSITNTDLNILVSSGLSVKLIAQSGEFTEYGDGSLSNQPFHGMMDAAGIVPLLDGGYVYVSNSEKESGDGGVYGLYFDEDGALVDYKTLLSKTDRNCGGGLTPWGTWISCEEEDGGQCWQIDPDPNALFHESPQATLLGGDDGGRYESVTCDNRDPDRPVFFTTEDDVSGALRRFEADGNGWDSLHQGGSTTYLNILDESKYEWTANEEDARSSAASYYMNSEGIVYHEGLLHFTAKETHTLFILDLENMTYEKEETGSQFEGKGSFNAQPDQIVLGNYKEWIYFAEDGGDTPGVYVRSRDGTYHALFESISGAYADDETVGIALSPDRRKLYAGIQDAGLLMEFTRDDGLPFL